MKPRFIVLEALDGVGKTTLATTLARHLGGIAMNTPGDALRAVAGEVLEGLGPNQEARCLFYAGSVIARGREARELVSAGHTVVMDRYWLSTLSYARARGVASNLDQVEAMVPAPDVTLLLTLDEHERQRRLRARGLTSADRETLEPRFRDRVLAEMTRCDRPMALRPVEVDLTGATPDDGVRRVLARIGARWQ